MGYDVGVVCMVLALGISLKVLWDDACLPTMTREGRPVLRHIDYSLVYFAYCIVLYDLFVYDRTTNQRSEQLTYRGLRFDT